jgi:hypothetical protein
MRTLGQIEPQLLVVALFSRHEAALDWGQTRLMECFGPIHLRSLPIDFQHTRYYERTMGSGLRKLFVAHERLVPMESLAEIKRTTIVMETELQRSGRFPEARPLNLDPGLLGLGKFCLATTKDQAHRVYLRDGIFAEVTLQFRDKAFHPNPWTYPDYREPAVLAFFEEARAWFVAHRHSKSLPSRSANSASAAGDQG